MIALECSGRLNLLDEGHFIRKNWGKILIAELVIAALGLTFLVIGWLAISNPHMAGKAIAMIYAGGIATSLVILSEIVSIVGHHIARLRGV